MTRLAVRKQHADAEARFEAIAAITGENEPAIVSALEAAIALLAGGYAVTRVADAIDRLAISDAIDEFDLDGFRDDLDGRLTPIATSSITDAVDEVAALEALAAPRYERAIELAETQSARLVTQIDQGTRLMLQAEIGKAIRLGENPTVAARRLRPLVGLTEQHAAAVTRQYRTLLAGGTPQGKALDLSNRYAGRLLTWRTETIARTEMLWSANAAQMDVWRQLAAAGVADAQPTLEWVTAVDDRVCPQCAPMEGVTVGGFDESFVSDTLGTGRNSRPRPTPVSVQHPPLHPNCRCTLVRV